MNVESTIHEIVNFIVSEPLRASLDIFSHFITGILLANIFFRNKPIGHKIIIGFIGGFLPDFDFFLQMLGIMEHGTFTHTPFFIIPLIIAGAIFFHKPFSNKSFFTYLEFISLCVILHIIADFGANYLAQVLYIASISLGYYVLSKTFIRKPEPEITTIN